MHNQNKIFTLTIISLGFDWAWGDSLVVITFDTAFKVIKESGWGVIFKSLAIFEMPSVNSLLWTEI